MERFFAVTHDEGVFTYARRKTKSSGMLGWTAATWIRSNVVPERQATEELRDRYKDLKYVEQAFER